MTAGSITATQSCPDGVWPIELSAHASSGSIAAWMVDCALAAIGHRLAAGDVDWRLGQGPEAAGRVRLQSGQLVNIDSDVELVVSDPR